MRWLGGISAYFLAVFCLARAAGGANHILMLDPALEEIISPSAEIELLATGFMWAEGPTWDTKRQKLYFSDVPANKAYSWSAQGGLTTFLDPSGVANNPEGFREPGTNGLLYIEPDTLLLANHGKRAIESMSLMTRDRHIVIDRYKGQRFNSPNDIAIARSGALFFTDPPYGLAGLDRSPLKELSFNGVYMLAERNDLVPIDTSLSFPNGVALSPDEQSLYVAVSDPDAPHIYRYEKTATGWSEKQVFFDATPYLERGWPGLPDGMAVAASGHLFATAPGGVFVIAPEGTLLGVIRLERPTANCAFGGDGSKLFITSQDRLLSVQTRVKGARWHD